MPFADYAGRVPAQQRPSAGLTTILFMIAYFDCFAGISGDMTLGALLDAGLPLAELRAQLDLIPVPRQV